MRTLAPRESNEERSMTRPTVGPVARIALDNLPGPIKTLLTRALNIAIGALKEEQREILPDTDQDVDDTIDSFNYIHDKLRRRP